ncbi:MAG TPA: hypothetical protein VFV10_07990 [Gammaproteobacteria bacterium]|nr:hypothetical protein [Gammaproteobacteria bacterium]
MQRMRKWLWVVAAAAALTSLPAGADPWRGYSVRPYVGFGFSYGYRYPVYPFGFGYGPFFYPPFYPPFVGVTVRAAPRERERASGPDSQGGGEQRALKLYVYPSAGQSEKQMADDRYDCHVWAVDQSGYDPTLGAGKKSDAEDYTRAFTACMEGRNYVVK